MIANARMYSVTPPVGALWRSLLERVLRVRSRSKSSTALAPISELWQRPDKAAVLMCGLPYSRHAAVRPGRSAGALVAGVWRPRLLLTDLSCAPTARSTRTDLRPSPGAHLARVAVGLRGGAAPADGACRPQTALSRNHRTALHADGSADGGDRRQGRGGAARFLCPGAA